MTEYPHQSFKRIRARYNPIPSEREKSYHLWLMENFPCFCGCGGSADCVHHPLQRHAHQRWRRDHEFVVPMTDVCHRALHAMGSERLFDSGNNYPLGAYRYRQRGYEEGIL